MSNTASILPANWDAGFKGRYRPACGGTEIPVYHPCKGWTLLVWDTKTSQRLLYEYSTDTFIPQ